MACPRPLSMYLLTVLWFRGPVRPPPRGTRESLRGDRPSCLRVPPTTAHMAGESSDDEGPEEVSLQSGRDAAAQQRSLLLWTSLLLQRPIHPAHRPGRARPRGPSWRLSATVRVRNGCPDVPAGCLRAACRCSAACCWSSVCQPCLLGPCCSGCIPVRALVSPAALGGVWWCWGCRAWHWAGAETYFVVTI